MQKNWHILYTKQNLERKVATLLNKKKIENFCAFNFRHTRYLRNTRLICEPLFSSYVFVNIRQQDIPLLLRLENSINLVYWKSRPATVTSVEIEIIKEFTRLYQNIKLEKTQVNINDVVRITDSLSYSLGGGMLSVENDLIKVNLPSLGLVMTAEIKSDSLKDFLQFLRPGVRIIQHAEIQRL